VCAAITEAQQPGKIPRIGFLSQAPITHANLEAFLKGLRELGYSEGKSLIIEYRDGKGNPDNLPALASDLVSQKVETIVVVGGEAALAARSASSALPIVMAVVSDPVRTGLVASLAQPGGNITGLSAVGPEASAKRLELLKETVPGFSRLGILAYTENPAYQLQLREIKEAAKVLQLAVQILEVRQSTDLEAAFKAARKFRVRAVSTLTSAFLSAHRNAIVKIAHQSKLPMMYSNSAFTEGGGLMSYGPDVRDNFYRAATYVDKILKGAKPSDLPV
jgi:putative ABC transport system substrate-binding protein